MNFTRTIPIPNILPGVLPGIVLKRLSGAVLERLQDMAPGFADALIGASDHFDDDRRSASQASGDWVADFLMQLDAWRVAGAIANTTPWFQFKLRRKSLPGWLRREVADSQGWECHYGRGQLDNGYFSGGHRWEIDHKWPVCRGGSDHPINLVAACRKHNRAKGAKVYTLFRIQLCLDAEARKCGN